MQPGVDGNRKHDEGLTFDRQTPLISANQSRLLARPTSTTGPREPRSPEKSRESFELFF